MIYSSWYIVQVLIGYNLVLPLLFYVFFLVVRKKQEHTFTTPDSYNPDYAIIVTAYQEITHIPETIQSILNLKYKNFLCYVVLDDCQDISSLKFEDERIILLKPEHKLQGNVRSHFYAIQNFQRAHNYLTIIDSDNLVDENYLLALNPFFNLGYKAIQGVREAKNLNSQYACLDAARDIYYHFYDGKILFNIGSSATLSGSGMAFDVSFYKDCLQDKDVSGAGFDKVLQFEIVKRSERIAFTEEAVVYDQKTVKASQLVNQRARWINTWFRYYKFGFQLVFLSIKKQNINQLLFGIVLLRPPLFMFLFLSILCLLINALINPLIAGVWIILFLGFILSFALPFKHRNVDTRVLRALKYIPSFIFFQFVSLFYSRNANKRSVATKHFD